MILEKLNMKINFNSEVLKEKGVISQEEFDRAKKKILDN